MSQPTPPTEEASTAVHSAGTWIEISTAVGGSTYVPVGEATSITGPGRTMDTIEVTRLLSPDWYREHKASWKDGAEVTIDVNLSYYDEGQLEVVEAYEARHKRNFNIWYPCIEEGGRWQGYNFAAYVTQVGPAFERDSAQKLNTTLKITGPVTEVN